MGFWRRLRTYLIGVGLGCFMVYFFFKDRQFDAWLPEGRVLEQIERSVIQPSSNANCWLRCTALSNDTLMKSLVQGEVDFGESETRREPCPIYLISSQLAGEAITYRVELCRDTAFILEMHGIRQDCSCR
jgi:hypothetical protein